MKRAVVVGSGAGGAMAARELQGAFSVTILEEGRAFRPFHHDLDTLDRLRATRLFVDERMIQALFPPMRVSRVGDRMVLVRGSCTGGTTALATANALRCDDALRELGLDLDEEFLSLEEELVPSTAHARSWRPATRRLFSACHELGLEPQATPKLVDYARCRRCGRCVLGCPCGAKWDSRVLLEQACSAGARLMTSVRVESVALEHGRGTRRPSARALGVVVRAGGRRRLVPADLVVLAAGGLGTPAILEASGVRTEPRLFVDPVLCVAAVVPEARLHREVPMPFVVDRGAFIVSPYFDHLSHFFNPAWRRPSSRIVSLMVKFADAESGRVTPRRVHKGLTGRDRRVVGEALEICTEVFARMGVPRDALFLGTLNAGHPGGTLPLTATSVQGVHDGRLPANLYVADATLLPRSLGKPPMLTIMALAKRVTAASRAALL